MGGPSPGTESSPTCGRSTPCCFATYAVLLRDAGRLDAAVDAHREAHALCWEAADGQIAANAYQAARTAARAGQVKDARD